MLRRRIAASFAVGTRATACPLTCTHSHLDTCSRGSAGGAEAGPGLLRATAVRRYVYKPPGSSEPSRLPWYHHPGTAAASAPPPPDNSHAAPTAQALQDRSKSSAAGAVPPQPQSPSGPAVPLHAQGLASILNAVVTPRADEGATAARAATLTAPAGGSGFRGHQMPPPSPSASAPTASALPSPAPSQSQAAAAPPPPSAPSFTTTASTPVVPNAATAAAASQAMVSAAAAALRRQEGALRPTPARRMAAVAGPTLDARVEDIVKVEETLASELTLPKVVQLLIDPQADGVERITMSEYVAMQPRRQLLALGGKKEWQQWLEQSPYYQQAARLAAESPAQDLAALQQAGIHSLQQWLEHPQLVKVSARTRTALDTAVAQSVEAYMAEVVQVVNTSNAVEDLLSHWVSDVMGKFILDSLQVPIDRASQAMWTKRRDWMPADVVRGGAAGPSGISGGPTTSAGQSSTAAAGTTMLRPGEACTLDHYVRFVQKVVSSVRQDYVANHAAMGAAPGGRGDEQAEREILERSYGVIAAALTQLLEQAVVHQLPAELQSLQGNGYLALDRVPGLLKRAGSLLELRTVPVRYFVFHSTVDEAAAAAAAAASSSSYGRASAPAPPTPSSLSGLTVSAPPAYAPGTFLTGSHRLDVSLGEWSGQPEPPSSTARESGSLVDDATEQEYLSVLHRLRRRVDTLAVTSLYEVLAQPERYGGNGFSATEAVGLHQLFGPAKLLEDRLTTLLHYPPAAADKPIHFIEAGPLSGKTALLEQLAERTARPGDKVVLVRYGGSATPYLPDLDDHPLAFAARFWFRVALASCPYLVRTEELYSRAPRSVHWWGHEKNWAWERYQSLLLSARNAGAGHRHHQQQQRGGGGGAAWTASSAAPAQLASILVDDVDRPLSAMQAKWGNTAALAAVALGGGGMGSVGSGTAASADPRRARPAAADANDDDGEDDAADVDDDGDEGGGGGGGAGAGADAVAASNARTLLAATGLAHSASTAAPSLEQQRQQVVALWLATGKSVEEHLSSCFTQISSAVGQVNFVFTGTAATPLLLAHCPAPCRRYYLPLSGGVGLQSRLRVLPLLATLHALHLSHQLDMPGLLYEVLKNAPALAGKALELFWSHRVSLMDLRTGLPRLMMGNGSAHPQLLQSYVPRELFAELPMYITLLQNPRRTRRRLVELLQRQLSSPTGYLNTELDTTPQDVKDGLVLPHNHTSSQVHPFALFAIFSRQDAIDERVFNGDGQLLDGSEAAAAAAAAAEVEREDGEAAEGGKSSKSGVAAAAAAAQAAAAAARLRSSTGVGSNERKVVRAWAEVWAEYRSVVATLSTTPSRKRDAMRILLHGALLLRSAAVAGAQLELNLKVPSFGFPLLASETRVRGSSSSSSAHHHHARGAAATAAGVGDALLRSATPDTVRRAVSAYKMFFASAAPSHFPFRPLVGLNGGCDVVFVCGSTLALYDIVTTTAQLRHVVARFAEALLGVLHVLERQVLPVDKVRAVQYVTVVSLDEAYPGADASSAGIGGLHTGGAYRRRRSSGSGGGPGAAAGMLPGGMSVEAFNPAAGASVPRYLDYDSVFEDGVMDRLRELQQALGITKDFRTLNELIDELERTHRVRVLQDVMATPEEVESLFSPTLLQLVPDATVLPAYTSAVVSAADLMAQALHRGAASAGGSGAAAATAAAGAGAVADAMDININDDDDDDGTDYVNIGEEEVVPGAELDDVASDARLSRDAAAGRSGGGGASSPAAGRIGRSEELLVADGDYIHESAALLEAMMNDELDGMTDSSARLQRQREETARELRRDLVMEDRINYNAPLPSVATPTAAGAGPSKAAVRAPPPPRSAAEEAEADALAWLHDVITPESLVAGLRGTQPTPAGGGGGAAPMSASAANAGVPLVGASPPAPGAYQQQQQQQQQQQAFMSPPSSGMAVPPGAAAVGFQYPAGAMTMGSGGGGGGGLASVTGPWTPNVAPPLDGTESISSVFPRTAAKREAGEEGPSSRGAGAPGSAQAADEDAAGAGSDEGDGEGEGAEGGEGEEGEEEQEEEDGEAGPPLDLQKLFDAVSSHQRRRPSASNKKKNSVAGKGRSARREGSRSSASSSSSSPVRRLAASSKHKRTAAPVTSAAARTSSARSAGSANAARRRSPSAAAPSSTSKRGRSTTPSSSGGKKSDRKSGSGSGSSSSRRR